MRAGLAWYVLSSFALAHLTSCSRCCARSAAAGAGPGRSPAVPSLVGSQRLCRRPNGNSCCCLQDQTDRCMARLICYERPSIETRRRCIRQAFVAAHCVGMQVNTQLTGRHAGPPSAAAPCADKHAALPIWRRARAAAAAPILPLSRCCGQPP